MHPPDSATYGGNKKRPKAEAKTDGGINNKGVLDKCFNHWGYPSIRHHKTLKMVTAQAANQVMLH